MLPRRKGCAVRGYNRGWTASLTVAALNAVGGVLWRSVAAS